jgi:vacuolar protein sorting-associated protein 13A/C
VDREGEHVHALRPKINRVKHRVACEVKLKDNVKIVTLRSTFSVENATLVPVELAIVDANGKRASEIYKIGQ